MLDLKHLFATIVLSKRLFFTDTWKHMDFHDDTRTRLLEAAGEVFAEQGFKAATVRKILERAGMSNVAAINYYFGDKETLYAEAVQTAFRGRSSPAALPDSWPLGTAPAVKLREFIRAFAADLIGEHGPAWRMQ